MYDGIFLEQIYLSADTFLNVGNFTCLHIFQLIFVLDLMDEY